MGTKICMNEVCRTTTSPEWKKGWGLKLGGFANLCYSCGSAYENSIFCETFHMEESGWRECKLCGKRIHCGCITSKYLFHYLDFGGIGCISCAKKLETPSIRTIQIPSNDIPNGFAAFARIRDPHSSVIENRMNGNSVDKDKLMQLNKTIEANESSHFPQTQKGDSDASIGQIKREGTMFPINEVGTGFPNLTQHSVGPSTFSKTDNTRPTLGLKDMYESLAPQSLTFSLSTPNEVLPFPGGVAEGRQENKLLPFQQGQRTPNELLPFPGGVVEGRQENKLPPFQQGQRTPNEVLPFPGGVIEGRQENKLPPFQQGQRTRHILPKPSKTGLSIGSEANKATVSQARIARPPAEGRGRNQLLPRYWPRITDRELQQLSGDLNSTIVPLFEKVLSASDAGRIGRLVLPKACAEAYFPSINNSEGLPIRIQDIKGKEWTFQFRFWPNNNSRMYVLEGVTPCIQNMQLQAGDTVIFSRIHPEGKLVMGFRKATNSLDMQDDQTSALPNGGLSGETSFSGVNGNLPTQARTNEDLLERGLIPEKKKTRTIGSKSKRLHMNSEDAMELRVTWKEAQDLLRPPPSVKPTIVMVEDHEFEEYDEPPVFGKRTIFTSGASGEQEQWAQCDGCFKWRRLPVDVLLPPKWMCSDNIWDLNRGSCSAAEEMSPREVERFLRAGKDFKKRRITENKVTQEDEPSGLDALATAAVLGDNAMDMGEHSVGATTKHPRHRPGCSCIVCIQPPSGKGKHKPTCICNVCLTVKRRFKTLMLRKKKRQSEREAEIALGKDQGPSKDEPEMAGMSGLNRNYSEHETSHSGNQMEVAETSKGQLDLNFHPNRDEDMLAEAAGMSMMSLVHGTSFSLEYLKQNGLTSLGPCLLSQAVTSTATSIEESEERAHDEECDVSVVQEPENKGDEG